MDDKTPPKDPVPPAAATAPRGTAQSHARLRRRRDRGRMILIAILAVSLAGNAVSLGALARLQTLRQDLFGGAAGAPLFPRDERRALGAAVRAKGDVLRPQLDRLVAARARVVEAGLARPFDRPALDAAMADLRRELEAMMIAVQLVVGDTLEARARAEAGAQAGGAQAEGSAPPTIAPAVQPGG